MNFAQLSCFCGEKPHDELMEIMAGYGNLVLLSNGENGTPLVIKEALMAGLPIVTNKYSSNDLDLNLPFIDIIPDDKLNDLEYIEHIIQHNRSKQTLKDDIRKYAVEHFSWEKLVYDYVLCISSSNSSGSKATFEVSSEEASVPCQSNITNCFSSSGNCTP